MLPKLPLCLHNVTHGSRASLILFLLLKWTSGWIGSYHMWSTLHNLSLVVPYVIYIFYNYISLTNVIGLKDLLKCWVVYLSANEINFHLSESQVSMYFMYLVSFECHFILNFMSSFKKLQNIETEELKRCLCIFFSLCLFLCIFVYSVLYMLFHPFISFSTFSLPCLPLSIWINFRLLFFLFYLLNTFNSPFFDSFTSLCLFW